MNEALFAELLASVQEGGAILRGEKEPSRKFEIAVSDVQSISERYDLNWATGCCPISIVAELKISTIVKSK